MGLLEPALLGQVLLERVADPLQVREIAIILRRGGQLRCSMLPSSLTGL